MRPSVARTRPLRVEVPHPSEDRPRLARVGLVAASGFVLGILWPWLAGVTLVPRPPVDELSPAADELASSTPAKSATASKHRVAPKATTAPTRRRVNVGKAEVTSCRDEQGRQVRACDAIPVDEILVPRLETLQGCAAGRQASGIVSVGIRLDFPSGKIEKLTLGRSTSVDKSIGKEVLACAERELASVGFSSVPHNHANYTVFYLVEFTPPSSAADADSEPGLTEAEVTEASGMATVAWVAARVREQPSKESRELARLASGARVKVVGRQGDWYKVRWNAKGSEGWVFKGAIGM